jgi:predicted amidohydrolase
MLEVRQHTRFSCIDMLKTLRIGAAQLKFRRTIPENTELIGAFIEQAASAKCDVVLFPECALTGYNVDFREIGRQEITERLNSVAAAARAGGINVLIGSPTFDRDQRFNSLVIFNRRGEEVFRYHKIHLTDRDAEFFSPGNSLAFFRLDGVPCTAIICHERRYPELVRLAVMMGAKILFHPNAGLDTLAVSRKKHGGRDGIAVRAFENQIFYVFANSVGSQGNNFWSAGDSKIVAPDSSVLALADNRDEMLVQAELDLRHAGRKYALEALDKPQFLREHWRAMLATCRKAARKSRSASTFSSRRAAPRNKVR